MRPGPEEFVKLSIDGVKLRDAERFDELARRIFPDAQNPRRNLFYNCLWLARAIRELSAPPVHGDDNDETSTE
jgi:hypothetical protein